MSETVRIVEGVAGIANSIIAARDARIATLEKIVGEIKAITDPVPDTQHAGYIAFLKIRAALKGHQP